MTDDSKRNSHTHGSDSSDDHWGKPIVITYPPETGYAPSVFTPESSLAELRRLAFAYRHHIDFARDFITPADYRRLQQWIVRKEVRGTDQQVPDSGPAPADPPPRRIPPRFPWSTRESKTDARTTAVRR